MVFLKDNYKYTKLHLQQADYINYRQLGLSHCIKHELIQGELSSIINMYCECDASTVDMLIGKMRLI